MTTKNSIECTTLGGNLNVNYGLKVMIMCPCECTNFGPVEDGGGRCACVGMGYTGTLLNTVRT